MQNDSDDSMSDSLTTISTHAIFEGTRRALRLLEQRHSTSERRRERTKKQHEKELKATKDKLEVVRDELAQIREELRKEKAESSKKSKALLEAMDVRKELDILTAGMKRRHAGLVARIEAAESAYSQLHSQLKNAKALYLQRSAIQKFVTLRVRECEEEIERLVIQNKRLKAENELLAHNHSTRCEQIASAWIPSSTNYLIPILGTVRRAACEEEEKRKEKTSGREIKILTAERDDLYKQFHRIKQSKDSKPCAITPGEILIPEKPIRVKPNTPVRCVPYEATGKACRPSKRSKSNICTGCVVQHKRCWQRDQAETAKLEELALGRVESSAPSSIPELGAALDQLTSLMDPEDPRLKEAKRYLLDSLIGVLSSWNTGDHLDWKITSESVWVCWCAREGVDKSWSPVQNSRGEGSDSNDDIQGRCDSEEASEYKNGDSDTEDEEGKEVVDEGMNRTEQSAVEDSEEGSAYAPQRTVKTQSYGSNGKKISNNNKEIENKLEQVRDALLVADSEIGKGKDKDTCNRVQSDERVRLSEGNQNENVPRTTRIVDMLGPLDFGDSSDDTSDTSSDDASDTSSDDTSDTPAMKDDESQEEKESGEEHEAREKDDHHDPAEESRIVENHETEDAGTARSTKRQCSELGDSDLGAPRLKKSNIVRRRPRYMCPSRRPRTGASDRPRAQLLRPSLCI